MKSNTGMRYLVFLMLVFWSAITLSQENNVNNDSYRLRKGDILEIIVMEHPEFSIHNVVILPDGKIQYPGLGSIQADSLTINEFTDILNKVIEKYVVNPIVTVFVKNVSNQFLNVLGYVSNPGQILLFEPTDLISVLSKAGGISNVKKCKYITIIRSDQSIEVLKVKDIFNISKKKKRTNNNQIEIPKLYVGDTVYVVEPKEFNWSRLSFFVSLAHVTVYLIWVLA